MSRELSNEEAKALGHKGGINSGKARRAKADLRRKMRQLLTAPLPESLQEELSLKDFCDCDSSYQDAFVIRVLLQALRGDARAQRYVIELSERPEGHAANFPTAPSEDMNKLYAAIDASARLSWGDAYSAARASAEGLEDSDIVPKI